MPRMNVSKTWKLYIGGRFPRSESGRTIAIEDRRNREVMHVCRGSRKDFRDAVEAARTAQGDWADRSPYLRGQILYRMAEMLEGRKDEFIGAIRTTALPGAGRAGARKEVDAAIDRLVCFAGWADKYAQVLGCHNPVAGPFYTFTVPEPSGVVALFPPETPSLLGLVALLAPVMCSGNTIIVLAGAVHPVPATLLGEVCATSDVPGGVVNIIPCDQDELLQPVATHRGLDAIGALSPSTRVATMLRRGGADNITRVRVESLADEELSDPSLVDSPWRIEPFVEMKTIWHPSSMK